MFFPYDDGCLFLVGKFHSFYLETCHKQPGTSELQDVEYLHDV